MSKTLRLTLIGITFGSVIGMLMSCVFITQETIGNGCTDTKVKVGQVIDATKSHCEPSGSDK